MLHGDKWPVVLMAAHMFENADLSKHMGRNFGEENIKEKDYLWIWRYSDLSMTITENYSSIMVISSHLNVI